MDAELEKQIKKGEKFFLDLTTGDILGATRVIESDPRYAQRFIPWTAPIPKGGRVDIQAWRRKQAGEMAAMSAGIAAAVGTGAGAGVDTKPETEKTATDKAPSGSPAGSDPADEGKSDAGKKDEEPLTAGQRMDKILEAMPKMKASDMTGSGFPKVQALSDICGFDVEGAERDAAWAAFSKANPNWKAAE